MNMHFTFCRETGPPAAGIAFARNRDPSLVAQLYLFSRNRKYLIRLKVLAKYGQAHVREQAAAELRRVAAYPVNGRAAWELLGDEPKDNNNVD